MTDPLVIRQCLSVATDPSWPVFCIDGADVIVVERAADLPIELDPVLVGEPVTLVDSAGRRLRMVISQPERRRWRFFQNAPEIIGVEVVDGEVETELLRQTLSGYLTASGVEIDQAEDIETFAREAARHIH